MIASFGASVKVDPPLTEDGDVAFLLVQCYNLACVGA
jgi:hypothetical protein